MAKELAYFRGILGGSNLAIGAPTKTSVNYGNTGSLLTTNAQYMRRVLDTSPRVVEGYTFHPVTDSNGTVWEHPRNTGTSSSLQNTGTLSASSVGNNSTGRWVWLVSDVNGFRSDFQLQTFTLPGGSSSIYGLGTPDNTISSLSDWFETHDFDQNLDTVQVDTALEVKEKYESKVSLNAFNSMSTTSANGKWILDTGNTGSSGTGVTLTGYGVVYEASGSFTGGNCGYFRSQELTYPNQSPTITFNYVMYSTTWADIGQLDLYWVVKE